MVALAEAYYRIRPDTSGFAEDAQAQIRRHPINAVAAVTLDAAGLQARITQIRAQIRDLGREKVRVDADVDAAMRQVAALKAELRAGGRDKVAVDADITAATARLDQFRAQLRDIGRQRATLTLDAGDAQAELRRVQAELSKVDGRTAHARVHVDISRSLRDIGLVSAAMAALVGVTAGAGLAVGVGAAAGAGIGVAVAGLVGVADATKALGDAEKNAGAEAAQAATRQLSLAGAMDQVKSAQAGLRNTVASAADAARNAAQRQADAARGLISAQRGLAAAEQGLTAARAEAAAQLRDLIRQQETLARQQEDLKRQTEDLSAAQRGSLLDVRQAKLDLDRTLQDPRATDLQREQARFAYDEAVRHNRDLKRQALDLAGQQKDLAGQQRDLARERAAADRRGVAGSAGVIAAQERVVEAQERVAAALRGIRDAAADSAAAQRNSAFQVAQAQQQVVAAQRAVQAASISAGTVGESSIDKIADAMRNLSPAGQAFARFMRGFIDGPLRELRFAAQEGLLPGLQAGLAGLGPIIAANLPLIRSFADALGDAFGGIIEVAGRLAGPFLRLGTAALRGLEPLQGVFDTFADSFGEFVDQVTGDGSLQRAMGAVVDLFGQLLPVLVQVLPLFVDLATQVLPPLTGLLVVLVPLLTQLAIAFAGPLTAGLRAVTPLLDWFGRFVTDHSQLVGDLAVAILAVVLATKAWAIALSLIAAASAATTIGTLLLGIGLLVSAFIIAWRHSERFRDIVIGVWYAVDRAKELAVTAVQAVAAWFGRLADKVGDVKWWIVRKFTEVVDFVRGLPGRMADAGRGIWDWLKAAFVGVINWIIARWNALEFKVPAISPPFGPTWGGFTIGVPDLDPIHLAAGGIVRATPGGTFANVAEGGRDEVVSPLNGPGGLEEALYRAMARALAGAELRLERRGSEVIARIANHGNLILGSL